MPVERINIQNHNLSLYIEGNPDDSGVRVVQNVGDRDVWIMTIVDNGNGFSVANFDMSGRLNVRNFKPKSRLFNVDGSMPALEVDDQIEINTPYNKMLVRNLDHDNPDTGVVIAYSDGVCLYGIALCEVNATGFRVALSK